MLTISPAKILVVLVVALIVLGPEKLPGMARQAGAFLGEIRRFRDRVESEMRNVMPEGMPLPTEIVRSPLGFLTQMGASSPPAASSTATDRSDPSPNGSGGIVDDPAVSPAGAASAELGGNPTAAATLPHAETQAPVAGPEMLSAALHAGTAPGDVGFSGRPWPGGPPYLGSAGERLDSADPGLN